MKKLLILLFSLLISLNSYGGFFGITSIEDATCIDLQKEAKGTKLKNMFQQCISDLCTNEKDFSKEEKIEYITSLTGLFPFDLVLTKQIREAIERYRCPPLGKFDKYDRASTTPRGDIELLLGGPFEQLKMTALARVYLDNIKNIQASWVTQGQKMGQISLMVGCNDMGSLMMEENVVSAVGTTYEMNLEALRDLIKTSGYIPVKRDYYYTALENKASTASISA